MTRTRENDTEVLEVAVELQHQDEVAADARRSKIAVDEAAFELGVEPEQLARAEAEVARRRAAVAAKRAKHNRLILWLAGLGTAAALSVGVYAAVQPAPPTPWAVQVDRGWSLDVSTGTIATSGPAVEDDREAFFVHVDKASPRADGTWFVNLDGRGVPAFAGHTHLSVELSGNLPNARVYLEAGTDERWRSPLIAIQSAWTKHRLALADFDHQQKVDGEWKVVSAADPENVTAVSIKLGHFVNDPTATGLVRVGTIEVE